jgi:hypothetical protein
MQGKLARYVTLSIVAGSAAAALSPLEPRAFASKNNPENVVTVTQGPRETGTCNVSITGNGQSQTVAVNITTVPMTADAKATAIRDAINGANPQKFHATVAGAVVTVFNGTTGTDPAWTVSVAGGSTREGDRVTRVDSSSAALAEVHIDGSVGASGYVSVGTESYVATVQSSSFGSISALRQALATDLTNNGVNSVVMPSGRIRMTVPSGDEWILLDVEADHIDALHLGFN